jgi:hypothetical protein
MQPLKLALLALAIPVALAQQASKPQIGKLTGIPSDFAASGNCTSSTQGYLTMPKSGKTKLTDAEIMKFIRSNLQNGYVITIYPETANGVFVDMECPAKQPSTATP